MKHVVVYRYRWLVLLSLLLMIAGIDLQWTMLAPVAGRVNLFYSTRFSFSEVMIFVFVVGALAGYFIYKQFLQNVRTGLLLRTGAVLAIVASVVKIAGYRSPFLMVFSQLLFSFAHSLVLVSAPIIMTRWFPIRERSLALDALTTIRFLSITAVQMTSPFICNRFGYWILLLLNSLFTLACMAGGLVLVKDNPPTPSSLEPERKVPLSESHRYAERILSFVYAFGWLTLILSVSFYDYLLCYWGVGKHALFGLVIMVSGIAGALVIPSLSDYLRKRKVVGFCSIVCTIPGLLLVFLADSEPMVWLGGSIFSFFLISSLSIGLQYANNIGMDSGENRVLLKMHFTALLVGVPGLLIGYLTLPRFDIFLIVIIAMVSILMLFLPEPEDIMTEEEKLELNRNREIVREN